MDRTSWAPRLKGFTLIELLVVVAIIAVLLSILLPSLGQAREQAKQVRCSANLQQIGIGFANCAYDNKGHNPKWDDGNTIGTLGDVMLTWVDVLYDLDYIGNVNVSFCPTDKRPDEAASLRGQEWDFMFVDQFGLGQQKRYGVRTSYAINSLINYNWPQDRWKDPTKQIMAMDGAWVWHGNINAMWVMWPKIFGAPTSFNGTPAGWEGAMSGWRHGRHLEADMLFCDSHVEPYTPRVPKTMIELRDKTVDTARVFTWLPGERTRRFDFDEYRGEVAEWKPPHVSKPRLPAFVEHDFESPASFAEELDPNYRTEKRLWKKLPANPADRL